MRYLGIDYGIRRVGLAICDANETISSPLCILENDTHLIDRIATVLEKESFEGVVVGLPVNMDDSMGPQAKLTLEFVQRLKKRFEVPIYLQDERLSSFAAQQKLSSLETKKKKRKKHIDAVAAAEILELFLENKNQH